MPGTPTTKYGIATFNAAGSDPVNTGHTQINTALATIDSNMAGYATGTFAGKPAAGKAGRWYLCTDTGQWLVDTGSVWVDANMAPQFVSSLPGSPYDGQEIFYQADLTNGVVWHLRYRSASASASKWEFVGGSALSAEVSTVQTVSGSTYTDLATVGPSIVVPLAGDYEFTMSAQAQGPASGDLAQVGLKIGAAAIGAFDDMFQQPLAAGPGLSIMIARTLRRNVSAAATTVKLQYATGGAGGTSTFSRRGLIARPVRVG